jgi:hypothetical protein
MFAVDSTIDTIQTGKKMFVNTFVPNKTIATAMNDFVDAQTEYTKKAVKTGTETATTFAEEFTKVFQDISKFDYAKAFSTKK